MPVLATRGQRFKAACWTRLLSDETAEAVVRAQLAMLDPDAPRHDTAASKPAVEPRVRREWASLEAELVAPCDAPVLEINIQSDRLPVTDKPRQWFVCIEDVALTPLAPAPAQGEAHPKPPGK
jgi:hypothetical protein